MSKKKVQENIELFKCPVCGNKMAMHNLKSLICSGSHCFDLAKHGYVNLLLNSVKTEYDQEMFKARNIVCKNGFFELMLQQVSAIILKHIPNATPQKSMILDVGCGEGSHLNHVLEKLQDQGAINFDGVGIDISKEGIKMAAKAYPDNTWCVGDLAKNPFMNKKFDVILNILSPSNYTEFNRIISDAGILIKVVPGSSYLKELRALFYDQTDKQEYSNEKVLQLFRNKFNMIDEQQILYHVELSREYLEHLIKMTPLSWSVSKEKIQRAFNIGLENITVDFTIMCGKKL